MISFEPKEYSDRRVNPRIITAIPALVDFMNTDTKRPVRESASVTTLGAKGISILSGFKLARSQYIDIYLEIPGSEVPLRLSGIVRWSVEDGKEKENYFHGIKLDTIPPISQSLFRSLVADQLLDQAHVNERRISRELHTKVVRFSNRSKKNIVGLLDSSINTRQMNGAIVIPPAYGEMKTDALMLAYYLAKNGFYALRYDATDHVGESEGEIFHTRLTSMTNDLMSAVDFLTKEFPSLPIGIIATSLSARVAIRAIVADLRIRFLIGIASVVDLQSTLMSVYKTDLVSGYQSGEIRGTADILGFNIGDGFLNDAIQNNFHNLAGTQNDLNKLTIPVTLFACENDSWVNVKDIEKAINRGPNAIQQTAIIPNVFHNLYEDRTATRETLKKIVACAIGYLKEIKVSVESVAEPTLREVAVEARLERQRMRLLSHFEATERIGFWEKYLTSFDLILKSADFNVLLQVISEQLGNLSGSRLLDAGCGNGNFGAWLMLSKEKRGGPEDRPAVYVGIDYAKTALVDAELRLQQIHEEQINNNFLDPDPMKWMFNVCDLNRSFPFIDAYFDKVCCNLVLSYVEDPFFTISEMKRVLTVGGVIVITSVKPLGNFSRAFNNFIHVNSKEEDLADARKLIGNASSIRHKEKEGHFNFFTSEELRKLLEHAGFSKLNLSTVFEGDIHVVSGVKT